jgi:hypothetical protein
MPHRGAAQRHARQEARGAIGEGPAGLAGWGRVQSGENLHGKEGKPLLSKHLNTGSDLPAWAVKIDVSLSGKIERNVSA